MLLLGTTFGSSISIGPDLRLDGNASPQSFATESGRSVFVVNAALAEGANYKKIFGPNRPTTLWDDSRRVKIYQQSIRMIAQQPVASQMTDLSESQSLLRQLDLGASVTKDLASALGSLHSNYIEGSTILRRSSNKISHALRTINPKTINGVKVPTTNLKHLGKLLQTFVYVEKIADFALGAALQEALAGDLALGRLDALEAALRMAESKGESVDRAVFEGIRLARLDLIRSEDYYGALMTELSDRKAELATLGLAKGVHMVQAKAVPMMKSFYMSQAGGGLKTGAAATKASAVAGLWAGSFMATYATITAILDQFHKMQIGVTSATVAYLVERMLDQNFMTQDRNAELLVLQAKYQYFDAMVDVTSGFLPKYHDFLTPGSAYKDAKLHFEEMRETTERLLLQGAPAGSPEPVTASTRSIIAVVDSSGSMSGTDPQNLRIRALGMMLDVLSEHTRLGIIDFDDHARTIMNPALLGSHISNVRANGARSVRRIDSQGGTDIPEALEAAARMISAAGLSDVAVILLTDGDSSNWDGTAPMLPAGTIVHTLAFSEEANRAKLGKVSAETGGIAEIALSANDLPDIISRLFEGAEAREVFLLERGVIYPGQEIWFEALIESGQPLVTVDMFWPGSDIDLELVSPGGTRYTSEQARVQGYGVESSYYDLMTISNPEPGRWRVAVQGTQVDAAGESFTLRASTQGGARAVRWYFSVPVPEVGTAFSVGVDTDGWIQWTSGDIRLTDPDGQEAQLPFRGGGLGAVLAGSAAASILTYTPEVVGYHRLRIELEGRTAGGEPVARVLERGFNVASPGQGQRWKHAVDPFIQRR